MDEASGVIWMMVVVVGFFVFIWVVQVFSKSEPDPVDSNFNFRKNLPTDYGYAYYYDGTGYAINVKEGKILLKNDSIEKIYNRSNIRKIEWAMITQEKTKLYGQHSIATRVGVAFDNSKAAERAESATGIFISVADIDDPTWKIKISGEQKIKRSFEILQQFLEEQLMDYDEYIKQRTGS